MEQGYQKGNPEKILKQHTMNSQNKTKKNSKKLTDWQKKEIRRKLYGFYMNRVAPSTKKLLKAVNDDENLPSYNRTSFQKVLERLRLKPLQRVGADIVQDYMYVGLRRSRYLNKIREHRKEYKTIFYLDEMWVDAEDIDSAASDVEESNVTRRLVLLHIGNENGFVAGAEELLEVETKKNREVIKDEVFEAWFEGVLQQLPANSVVVMDNVPHHRRRIDSTPHMFSPKEEIHAWLRERGVEFEENEFKAELIMKVDRIEKEHRVYAVNEMAKRYNIEVLRLHTYHIEFNPIEDIWVEMKRYISKNSYDSLEDFKKLVLKSIENVTVGNWQLSVERVKTMEEYYHQLDYIIDDVVDDFLDKTEGFEDDTDESETESDD